MAIYCDKPVKIINLFPFTLTTYSQSPARTLCIWNRNFAINCDIVAAQGYFNCQLYFEYLETGWLHLATRALAFQSEVVAQRWPVDHCNLSWSYEVCSCNFNSSLIETLVNTFSSLYTTSKCHILTEDSLTNCLWMHFWSASYLSLHMIIVLPKEHSTPQSLTSDTLFHQIVHIIIIWRLPAFKTCIYTNHLKATKPTLNLSFIPLSFLSWPPFLYSYKSALQ